MPILPALEQWPSAKLWPRRFCEQCEVRAMRRGAFRQWPMAARQGVGQQVPWLNLAQLGPAHQ
eukprot:6903756-Alexandrium_andersonii.AAC.1